MFQIYQTRPDTHNLHGKRKIARDDKFYVYKVKINYLLTVEINFVADTLSIGTSTIHD